MSEQNVMQFVHHQDEEPFGRIGVLFDKVGIDQKTGLDSAFD